MRTDRITDGQAAALLDGRAPEGRDDLQDVAALVGALRLASFEPPAQPSPALAARLDLDRLAWVAAAGPTALPDRETDRTTILALRPARRRIKRSLGWFTGLGIAAQLAVGAGAVGASAAGIGMAGALPPMAQEIFDTVVTTVASADDRPGGADEWPKEGPKQTADDAGGSLGGPSGSDDSTSPEKEQPEHGQAAAEDSGTPTAGIPDGAGPLDGPLGSELPGDGHGAGKPDKAEKPDKASHPEKAVKPEKSSKLLDAVGKPGAGKDLPTPASGNPARGNPVRADAEAKTHIAKENPAATKSGKDRVHERMPDLESGQD